MVRGMLQQVFCECGNAGVVPDHEDPAPLCPLQGVMHGVRVGMIKCGQERRGRVDPEPAECLPGPRGGGTEDLIGKMAFFPQPLPERGRIPLYPRVERAIMIGKTEAAPIGFRMAHQNQCQGHRKAFM